MIKKILTIAAAALCLCLELRSQDLKSGFFLDGYLYGYRQNPALQPSDGVDMFAGLLLDDFGASASSNVGLSDLLFRRDGALVTGLNSKVEADEFLPGLPEMLKLRMGIDNNLFSFGRRSRDGASFTAAEINVKAYGGMALPKELFEFLKCGTQKEYYYMDNFDFVGKSYLELSFNHSRNLGDVTLGASLKGLLGLAHASMQVDYMNAIISDPLIYISDSGSMTVAARGLDIPVTNDRFKLKETTYHARNAGISGYGGALDLGISATLAEGLSVSAALLDLGFIVWKPNYRGVMDASWYLDMTDEDQFMEGDPFDLVHINKVEDYSTVTEYLPVTFNFGARYVLPFAPDFSAGLFANVRTGPRVTRYHDIRAGITYTPSGKFSVTVNTGRTELGSTFGGALSLNAGRLNWFLGMDGVAIHVTPQMIPVNSVEAVFKTGFTYVFRSGSGPKD